MFCFCFYAKHTLDKGQYKCKCKTLRFTLRSAFCVTSAKGPYCPVSVQVLWRRGARGRPGVAVPAPGAGGVQAGPGALGRERADPGRQPREPRRDDGAPRTARPHHGARPPGRRTVRRSSYIRVPRRRACGVAQRPLTDPSHFGYIF